jgi:hypothetical protein
MARPQQGAASGQNNPPRPQDFGRENAQDIAHQDLRELSAVLQDIIPTLDRIQNRSPQSAALGVFAQQSVETLAAVSLVSDLGADSLRRLTAYLDANAENFAGLENLAPSVAAAARALAARDYAQAFTLLFDVYRNIAILRLDDPRLPTPGSVPNRLAGESRRPGEDSRRPGEDFRRSGEGNPEASPPN